MRPDTRRCHRCQKYDFPMCSLSLLSPSLSHLLSLLSLSNPKVFQAVVSGGQSEKAGIWVLIPHTLAWTPSDHYVNSQERSYFDLMHTQQRDRDQPTAGCAIGGCSKVQATSGHRALLLSPLSLVCSIPAPLPCLSLSSLDNRVIQGFPSPCLGLSPPYSLGATLLPSQN